MRVVQVTNNYTPFQGGVTSSINAYTTELRAQGVDSHIVTLDFGTAENDPEYVHRIHCRFRFKYKKNHMALPVYARSQLRLLFARLKPDIVHVHHPFLLGKAAADVARALGISIVFTHHTQYEAYTHYVPLPQILTKHVIRRRLKTFCAQAQVVITPSATIAQSINSYQPQAQLAVLPSPLLPIHFAQQASVKSAMHTPVRLLYVGRFTEEKNITVLIDMLAARTPGSTRLTLVGYGYHEQALRDYAYAKLGERLSEVQFICSPSKESLVQLYRAADLFVFSSVAETQGLVLAEAMAAGTPVIALYSAVSAEIIQHGINGYLVPDSQAMSAYITSLEKEHALFEQISANSLETAHRYHPAILGTKLRQLYQSLIGQ